MTDNDLQAVYRILDASANRAGEGLRVLEEYARFVLDDPDRTATGKTLRHDLTSALRRLSRDQRLRARDTRGDVGTEIRTESEYRRSGWSAVIASAAARTQQSLRTLEEYGKLIDPGMSVELEQIRYRCYSWSADLELQVRHQSRQRRLTTSHLYVLIDCRTELDAFERHLTALADAGVDVFQLRDPDADDRTLMRYARAGAAVAQRQGALFIVNDRPDIAAVCDADGVHVGQDEMPVAESRTIVGPNRLIGVSTHSIPQARQAQIDGADYIGCGPVFAGRTKSFATYVGTPLLRAVADQLPIPAFAIGGIDTSNVDQVIEAGFCRIAVTGAVRDADDPVAAASRLKARLMAAAPGPVQQIADGG